jgi:hypothetical protein
MKMIVLILVVLIFQAGCKVPGRQKETYGWFSYEVIPRGPGNKIIGKSIWEGPVHIKQPIDTFEVYGKYDSIRMITPDMPAGNMFRKINLTNYKWKPKPDYGNKLFFLGTYATKELPGFYTSYYATKDWKSLMQVEYSNPGNLIMVLLFSKDSINILKKSGIIIDPKDEQSEPERPVLQH